MLSVANCIVVNGHTILQIELLFQLLDYLIDLFIVPWVHQCMSEINNHPGQMS